MENESMNDIIAEIRAYGAQPPPRLMWLEIADRLEAAWKREREPKPLTIAEWIDKTETVADIAAVLRRYVLPSLAERLEAAWKRERAFNAITEAANERLREHLQIALEGNKKPVGNAAAMREALERFMVGSCIYPCVEMCGYDEIDEMCMSCAASPKKDGDCPYEAARKALSAPARNCDLFATVSDARKAFNEWLKHNTPISFGGWLLRLAAERKGDGDGSK